jgi:Asp-tRNA(Asn)/Glu-tRNA(Gln) amidotransferase A subunit family amidase
MGKSRTVNAEIMEKIVDRLAQGETLVDIVKSNGMPTYRAVTRAVAGDEEMWELYRKGRILQAEYYVDHLNGLAMAPLPKGLDVRELNAEVNRRRLEIDTLKWTTARNQPFGIRDKKEDQQQAQTFTISWAGGDVEVNTTEVVPDQKEDAVTKH